MTTGLNLVRKGWWLALMFAFGPWLTPSRAQNGAVKVPIYKDNTQIKSAIITGLGATNIPHTTMIHVQDFKLHSLRDGQETNIVFTAEAPECRLVLGKGPHSAEDPGPIQLFSPTTNLFVLGRGFFISETNQLLIISNDVETRVARTFLRSSPLFAGATNGTVATNDATEMVHIFSDRLEYNLHSNVVDYLGHVRVVDPQFQLTAPLLTVQMGSNQTVTMMFARVGVTLTPTGKGTATGATAHYYATNGITFLDLAGDDASDAAWHNGDQEANSRLFTYRPDLHFLTADDRVRVRWPNPRTNAAAPPTFRFLEHADHVDLQMTPDGRAVDALTALGGVSITNQADHSRATGGKAVYGRTNDLFTLTENPVWRTDQMAVEGETLSAEPSNSVFRAQGHARVKLHVASGGPNASTNQWLHVTSDDILDAPDKPGGYLVTIRGQAQAQLQDGETVLDKLSSQTMFVHQNSKRQLESVSAHGDVRGETAPDAKGVKKTVSCGDLAALYDPATGRWQDITADLSAELESFGAAVSNHLTADHVTAHFSATTNQMESARADGSVIFLQTAPGKTIHATGDHATYTTVPTEKVELIGHPFAETDKGTNSGSDRLRYDPKTGEMESFGRYHITPRATATNKPPAAKPHR